MNTICKINPHKEYECAKNIVFSLSETMSEKEKITSLGNSIDNLKTVINVLMEREEARNKKQNPPKKIPSENKKNKKKEDKIESKKLPSKKYPDAEIREKIVKEENLPSCPCCQKQMQESGLFEISEKLEVIPKKYIIERTSKVKYNCGHCHGSMITTPSPLSIVPGSNYGDSLVLDVCLSKYCDLIPIERYCSMAARQGLENLPTQSMIGLTHHAANFFSNVYDRIKLEVLQSQVAFGDETPHNMLEGDKTKNWFLWGFLSKKACYFEVHNTRSGNIAFDFLNNSSTEYFVSDGYAGYKKAIRELKEKYNREITEVYCNSHAYRYFKNAAENWTEEIKPILEDYQKIYDLEEQIKEKNNKKDCEDALTLRRKMLFYFEKIKEKCKLDIENAMPHSAYKKALQYFLNHYQGLIICTGILEVPLDNNLSERNLRSAVIGRKTWYGTHSKRGASTNAILFSIIESCKMNNVNPRNYFPWIKQRIFENQEILTPYEYSIL